MASADPSGQSDPWDVPDVIREGISPAVRASLPRGGFRTLSIDVGIRRAGVVLGRTSSAWADVAWPPGAPEEEVMRTFLASHVVPEHAENLDILSENGSTVAHAKAIGPMKTILFFHACLMRRKDVLLDPPPHAVVVEIQDATNAFMRQTSTAIMGLLVGHFEARFRDGAIPYMPVFTMVRGNRKMLVCDQVMRLHTPLQRHVFAHGGALPALPPAPTSVADLKDALRARRLPLGGKREDLAARLRDAVREERDQAVARYREETGYRTETSAAWEGATVADLKRALKDAGLRCTGTRADLMERVVANALPREPEDTGAGAGAGADAAPTTLVPMPRPELLRTNPRKYHAMARAAEKANAAGTRKRPRRRRDAYVQRKLTSVDAVKYWLRCETLEEDLLDARSRFVQYFETLTEQDKRDVADATWQMAWVAFECTRPARRR